jgi:hypothetical protein
MATPAVDPYSLANEARIISNKGRFPVLLVEGSSDKAVLAGFLVSADRCLPADGFNNVVGALRHITGWGGRYACGLVDGDRYQEVPADLLFFVESAGASDCDTVILTTVPIVTRMLSVLTEGRLSNEAAEACLERAIQLCAPISALNRVSRTQAWGLSLDRFPFAEIARPGSVDIELAVRIAVRRSKGCSVTEDDVLEQLRATAAGTLDRTLCRGHHLSAALVVAVNETGEQLRLGGRGFETYARVAFAPEHFEGSALAVALRHLELRTGLQLLRTRVERSPVEVGQFHDSRTPADQGKLGGRGGT